MISRIVSAGIQKTKKSILLLGPRQTGKSTLINGLAPDLSINFAKEATLIEYAGNPDRLDERIQETGSKTIFIDEVQKLPSILNTVQALVDDDKNLKFYLTGSSARKLRRGGANLLPGRVIQYALGPIIAAELDYDLEIKRGLRFGYLPEMVTNRNESENREILSYYSASYLKEEIKAEALTKSLDAFTRFLFQLAGVNAKFVDYTKLSARAKISRHSCPNYFEIFEDTLLGYRIYPDPDLIERADLVKHPKFFFFDGGVYNGLVGNFDLSPERVGLLSEQLAFSQIFHSACVRKQNCEIFTFRTRGGLEVDFLVKLGGKYIPIEVKFSDNLGTHDVSALGEMKKYFPKAEPLLVHMGKRERKISGIWALPLAAALRDMGL